MDVRGTLCKASRTCIFRSPKHDTPMRPPTLTELLVEGARLPPVLHENRPWVQRRLRLCDFLRQLLNRIVFFHIAKGDAATAYAHRYVKPFVIVIPRAFLGGLNICRAVGLQQHSV